MSDLLVGALSVLLATNRPAAVSNYFTLKTGIVPALRSGADTQDPRYPLLQKVMEEDDAAEDEIGRWLDERQKLDPNDPRTESSLAFHRRVDERNGRVRTQYEALIRLHPDYAAARNAFATFLEDTGDEEGAILQLEKASELDPKDPAVWNNLANHYGHVGPVHRAFASYERAIALNPFEPVYRYNLGTVVFLFRKDAMEHYHCDEAEVFRRALDLYREARRLRPHNFRYAFDLAQTYYGVKAEPASTPEAKAAAERRLADAALAAWRDALELADNDRDRDGIALHFARWHIRLRDFDTARKHLLSVSHPENLEIKARLLRNLDEKSTPRQP